MGTYLVKHRTNLLGNSIELICQQITLDVRVYILMSLLDLGESLSNRCVAEYQAFSNSAGIPLSSIV